MKNYHTHTSRCHHAIGKDEEYVLAAIQEGYSTLGFSDHTCWPYRSSFRSRIRMAPSEMDGYCQSIRELKDIYQTQMEILCGLEAEFFPDYMEWLVDLCRKKDIDYLIFGNHYYHSDEYGVYFGSCGQAYIQNYIDSTIAGLRTGLYSCLAHPELIMLNGFSWNDQLEEGFFQICQTAKELDIPLEYNVYGVTKSRQMGFVSYPHPRFWKIASQVKNKAIIGMDAHQLTALKRDLYQEALDTLSKFDVDIVETLPKVDFKTIKYTGS